MSIITTPASCRIPVCCGHVVAKATFIQLNNSPTLRLVILNSGWKVETYLLVRFGLSECFLELIANSSLAHSQSSGSLPLIIIGTRFNILD